MSYFHLHFPVAPRSTYVRVWGWGLYSRVLSVHVACGALQSHQRGTGTCDGGVQVYVDDYSSAVTSLW